MVSMRVAVLASSIRAGIRIASDIESVPGVDVFVVLCKVKMMSSLWRWFRELLLIIVSLQWRMVIAGICRYALSAKLVFLSRALDDPISIEKLRAIRCEVGLHAANVIYRDTTISVFESGILNAHIGILPEYRGRSVAEWSVLQGDPTGVTVFFIDSGIDTGRRIVLREFIPPDGRKDARSLKNMLFGRDSRLYRKALEALLSPGFQFEQNNISKGRRYYVMSKLFTEVVNDMLRVS